MDIYVMITDRIIAQMEQGVIPWQKPWTGVRSGAISRSTGKPYSLLNQMLLMEPGEYLTFKQCTDEGGKVKKGAKAKIVVFWKIYEKEKRDTNGNIVRDKNGGIVTESIPLLRYFQVFHISECEGIEPKWSDEDKLKPLDPIEQAEATINGYVQRSGVRLEFKKQDKACYKPSIDTISMPLREQFTSPQGFYETLFHETVHSTGHKSRLARFEDGVGAAAFGSQSYSKEELVAEIGAAALLHTLGIETPESVKNAAAYVQSWLRVLKNDNKFIVSAASRAEKAVNLIVGA